MVNVKCMASKGAIIPEYKTAGAAGADLCALLNEPLTIPAGKFAMVPTGLFFEIPEGYEVQVRPRSGLAAKNGVTVLNTPGTIDSDYRGEIISSMWMPIFSGSLSRPAQMTRRPSGVSIRPCSLSVWYYWYFSYSLFEICFILASDHLDKLEFVAPRLPAQSRFFSLYLLYPFG